MNDYIKDYYNFVMENRESEPKTEIIKLTEKQHSFQYVGGQITDNKLYGCVNSATKMLKYDISTGDMEFVGDFSCVDFKWTGGGIYEDNLYFFPRVENSLLIYSPTDNTFTKEECEFNYEKEHHYGGVITDNGIIYQPPRNTNHILKWDLNTKKCEKIYINNKEVCRYCSNIIHPNGYIYFIPEKDFDIIKMNIKTEKSEYLKTSFDCMCFNCVIGADGNIYGFRSATGDYGKGIVKINVECDTVELLHTECEFGAYGTKNAINGKIYAIPGYYNDVWEFDPFTNSIKKIYTVNQKCDVHYAGGPIDINGDIYSVPVKADNVLKLSFGHCNKIIPKDIYNKYFRNFY